MSPRARKGSGPQGFAQRMLQRRDIFAMQLAKQATQHAMDLESTWQQTVAKMPLRRRAPIALAILFGTWGKVKRRKGETLTGE